MHKDNENIELTGEEALSVLSEINYLLISLRDIARYYHHSQNESDIVNNEIEYCKETTGFIDRNKITHRLAHIRMIITEKFNIELGDDYMDDIEREMEKIKYWEKPGD
ncbi:hypothetical protein AB2B46_04505 [Kluyvera intermedia]|uniref:hypothetical protein n=1 Tax=Kluyvera intermedia TaxID=61648 RepID=UPI0034A5C5E7